MNKTYTPQEIITIQQSLSSIYDSLTQQEQERDKKSPEWTTFKILKILYHIANNPTFTQKKCIADLVAYFQGKTENSIKEIIKRINSNYSKEQLLDLAREMKENPENISYIKGLQDINQRKYMRRFNQLSKGLIAPPPSQFDRLASEYLHKLSNLPTFGGSDYSTEEILHVFPEYRKYWLSYVTKLQEFSGQTEEQCVNRLVSCSLDLEMAKRSIEEPSLIWDRVEDIQLIDSLRKKEESEIVVFSMYKGEESLAKRRKFLEKLEASMVKYKTLESK